MLLLREKLNTDAFKKYRVLSKIKLRPPIEIEWLLNFRASTLYVKNKMAEASILSQRKNKKKSFSAIVCPSLASPTLYPFATLGKGLGKGLVNSLHPFRP